MFKIVFVYWEAVDFKSQNKDAKWLFVFTSVFTFNCFTETMRNNILKNKIRTQRNTWMAMLFIDPGLYIHRLFATVILWGGVGSIIA